MESAGAEAGRATTLCDAGEPSVCSSGGCWQAKALWKALRHAAWATSCFGEKAAPAAAAAAAPSRTAAAAAAKGCSTPPPELSTPPEPIATEPAWLPSRLHAAASGLKWAGCAPASGPDCSALGLGLVLGLGLGLGWGWG